VCDSLVFGLGKRKHSLPQQPLQALRVVDSAEFLRTTGAERTECVGRHLPAECVCQGSVSNLADSTFCFM
jgi:hypothetical protein